MSKGKIIAIGSIALLLVCLAFALGNNKRPNPSVADATTNPALTVSVIHPEIRDIPIDLHANGSIAAWQEAIIGAEVGDLRLDAVNVQIGETVKKGQILATFANESVLTDIAQSKAMLAEAEANLSEAKINAARANKISPAGALSAQQVDQYLTIEKTAYAKVQLAKAQLDAQLLRLKYTKVMASDDGVISSRTATLGAVAAKGQELFRLIRQNRLEWRGELTAAEMTQLRIGAAVSVEVPNVGKTEGTVRFLAPTLNEQNRNGLVYVDLPHAMQNGLRAGMFAHGEFHLGSNNGLTVPQDALSLRDGFSYVFRLAEQSGDRARVNQVKVQLGRRSGDRLEVLSGISLEDRLVASGASFLTDGDSVRVAAP